MEPLSTNLVSSVNDPLPVLPNFFPKWTTRSRNTLRIRDKDHFEACNLYIQVCYIGNLYQRFELLGERPFTWSSKFLPKCITWSVNTLRRKIRFILKLKTCTFRCATWEPLTTNLAFFSKDAFRYVQNFPPVVLTSVQQSVTELYLICQISFRNA